MAMETVVALGLVAGVPDGIVYLGERDDVRVVLDGSFVGGVVDGRPLTPSRPSTASVIVAEQFVQLMPWIARCVVRRLIV